MKKKKVTIIGAGSTYQPELVSGLIAHRESLPLGSLYLMDIDDRKNEIVSGLSQRMLKAAGMDDVKVVLTDDLSVALQDADYVITQIRVGGLDARIRDEKIPLRYGLLGQETTGIGGFMKAMRTIPVMMNIASIMEKVCPNAFLINFTNPSGLITEMLLNHTKVHAIGLCNVPINMLTRAKEFFNAAEENYDYDFWGLNHLSFLTGFSVDGKEKLRPLFDLTLEESGIRAMLTDDEYTDSLMKVVRGIPCSYLQYYYFRDDRLHKCMLTEKTRGEVCKEIEEEILREYSNPELKSKPESLSKRGGARYSEAAINLIDAIENDLNNLQVVDVKNGGALPFLFSDDVVEVKCRIGKNGATPIAPVYTDNAHIVGLVQAVKAYERLACKAGVEGDLSAALAALTVHPLIGDVQRAEAALHEMLRANKEYLPQFAGKLR